VLKPRIIPCLLLQNGGLVKTVRFKEPKYVGDPINAVRIFNEKEADELIVLDIAATPNAAEPNFRLIAQFAAECRMPLCYGGGVKTAEQARRIVGLGVEKVAVSSGALENPRLVSSMAEEIGSQSVVVVLDVRKARSGAYEVWRNRGQQSTGRGPTDVAKEMETLGAGEIVVNAVDEDGRMAGYDLQLAALMMGSTKVPLTFLGGAGSLLHIADLLRTSGIVGAAAGSLFVFKGPYRAVLINYPRQEQKEELVRAALR
jgi:cyclase